MHGVVNLDKPAGISSQQAVTRVKRIYGVKKAGHAGTLDPMATGVLLVCLGEATKISSLLMDMPKEYEAELFLGVSTDTLDAEGEVVEERTVSEFTADEIQGALEKFRGAIRQTPPMYSALKKDGVPLYKLARKGVEVERKEREVNIYSIECTGYEHPRLRIRVGCSKGTYIRTLAEDIAGELGTIAHLSALRRTSVGGFGADRALAIGEMRAEDFSPEALADAVVPVDAALGALRAVVMNAEDYRRASSGGLVDAAGYGLNGSEEILRLKGPGGELFAIGSLRSGRIKVDRMLHLKGQT